MTASTSNETKTRNYTHLKPKWHRYFPAPTYKTIEKSSKKAKPTTTTACVYNNQYSLMYTSRLEQLRQRINIPKDNNIKFISRIIGLQDDDIKCIVKGTIIKQYTNSVIEQELNECNVVALPMTTNTYKDKDLMVLEDESGRVELVFEEKLKQESKVLSTGVVVGVIGRIESCTGRFIVEELLYPTLPRPPQPQSQIKSGNYVALMSGLNIGLKDEDNDKSNSLRRALLLDYLSGEFESTFNITKLIIAGGNIQSNESSYVIHELDLFLTEACANGIPVDILPGKYDPTNANFPYRNFHSCLFPSVTKNYGGMIHLAGNPYCCDLDDVGFLGTDGSNILNFMRFTNSSIDESNDDDAKLTSLSPMQALEYTLKYNLIAPTAPDTIPTFPFLNNEEGDPLVMECMPNVYFIGNCAEYQTKTVEMNDDVCRLICVPDFSKSGQIVLVDLDSLDCEIVKIIET